VRAKYRDGANRRDVDLLISDLIGRSVAWVVAHGDESIDEARLDPLLQRRLTGEPLQYIRGRTEFFGHEFYVDDRVLIPRPETELLVEAAMARAPRGARVVDIGTGSGCIAVSLQRARPDLRVVATDVSIGALAVARRNGATALVASDVLAAIRGAFDLIVANPPYIVAAEVEQLQTEVRDYEPRVALTPGPRGTEVIERILQQAGNAIVMMEMAMGQESAVRTLAAANRFHVDDVIADLAGIPRVVILSAGGRR
jgi:release factor glutamine methyltransferase